MNKKIYNTLKKKCINAESRLNLATESLAEKLQPYFKDEIDVLYQPSDGFVVLVLNDVPSHEEAPPNLPIDEVFKTITDKPDFYLS